jgi:protein-L-isoaspartate(D-aspartate) O-methyltransferase
VQRENPPNTEEAQRLLRERMVDDQIVRRGVSDQVVCRALRTVPRHLFVPENRRYMAYVDSPLPIGNGQTISQPYIVAVMTELCRIRPGDRVLEVGTGSGYQAAVLAEVGAEVFTVEIVPSLADGAKCLLEGLGYAGRVHVRESDGYFGWPEQAPFRAILLAASPPEVPEPLLCQLEEGGRLVGPVGRLIQDLVVLERDPNGPFRRRLVFPVTFVPMTGKVAMVGGES